MTKITIIGAGSVGSTIAYTLTYGGIASEIVMIDINNLKAEGEAIDIRQGTSFCPPCSIYNGDYPDAANSNIVIITSGVPRKPGQTRLDLAKTNINVLKSIIPNITKYAPDATYIIVSNPVDILTYVFTKYSGIPENRIIGSGTILDTARLRSCLADHFHVNPANVHACVLGEHGDSSFIPWSTASISDISVFEYQKFLSGNEKQYSNLNIPEVEQYVRKSGARVIECKGATYYAVSMSVCHICKCLLKNVDTALTVSTMMHGEYGLHDVCLSLLCNVSKDGVKGKLMHPLVEEEIAKLHYSAECLRKIIEVSDI